MNEARLLLQEAIRRSAGKSPAHEQGCLHALIRQREQGVPLQYILGHQAFWDHEFLVDPSVLIPRPETEVLVNEFFEEVKKGEVNPVLGLELGLGSGNISITLLARYPGLNMLASEISDCACLVARENARRILGDAWAGRLKILEVRDPGEVLEPFVREAVRADFLISNPPYLGTEDEIDPGVLTYEPWQALIPPGWDESYFYRGFAQRLKEVLKPGGQAFFEVSHEKAAEIADLFVRRDFRVTLREDLTGRKRILVAYA